MKSIPSVSYITFSKHTLSIYCTNYTVFSLDMLKIKIKLFSLVLWSKDSGINNHATGHSYTSQ